MSELRGSLLRETAASRERAEDERAVEAFKALLDSQLTKHAEHVASRRLRVGLNRSLELTTPNGDKAELDEVRGQAAISISNKDGSPDVYFGLLPGCEETPWPCVAVVGFDDQGNDETVLRGVTRDIYEMSLVLDESTPAASSQPASAETNS